MFLSRLNEQEKVAFLEIAHHFAWSNNDFSDKQKITIAQYCLEMQIEDIDHNEDAFDLRATLNKITKEHQKTVLLETMALAMADHVNSLDELHAGEKEVLRIMIEEFGLNQTLANIYADWTKAMLSLVDQGHNLISL